MIFRLVVTAVLLLATLLGGSQPLQAQAEQPSGVDNADIAARAAKLQPVEMNSAQQLAKLEPWELQVVEKMIQAAQYMNAAYWQQVDPEGQILFASLPAARVDSNLDLSVGPHEVYDDQLTGQKAFYKANVLIVDRRKCAVGQVQGRCT
ncbi:MAG: hypothetical protein IPK16_25995 [Anaerolineales bacterium]|nr:hypothetical protein [Anaerolineales bacterium]